MTFIWPAMLLSLLLVPVLVAGYVRLTRARARDAAELGSMSLVEVSSGRRPGRRRHLPFAMFVAAVALLLVGGARPEAPLALPRTEGTVILAFDVSNSMIADDLEPSRIDAAKEAGRTFVRSQPATVQIGVVAFSDGGLITQPPTFERGDVLQAIDRLSPEGGTSLGQGIFTSLNAIAGQPISLPEGPVQDGSGGRAGEATFGDGTSGDVDVTLGSLLDGIDIGYFGSAVIVLLSDGEDTTGMFLPLAASELAATAGVRIFPIGIGSAEGALVELDGFTVATRLDEPLLEEIAASTNGTYFRAEDSVELSEIYETIDLQLTFRAERTEVTGLVAGLGVLVLLAGTGLSMAWFGRVP